MGTGKYEHLFKPLKIAEMPGQAQFFKNTGNADVNRWLNGRDHLEGLQLNFSWGFYTGLGDWHPGMDPHVHPYPECLVFGPKYNTAWGRNWKFTLLTGLLWLWRLPGFSIALRSRWT
jgi:hypothetical protein